MARILLVDDDPRIRSALASLLAGLGHEVFEAGDGREALERLRRQPVEVVLTDILMPENDGLEVIQAVRREYPGIAVIAMSGGSARLPGTDTLQVARTLGAHAILAKPFGSRELREAVAAALRTPPPRPPPLEERGSLSRKGQEWIEGEPPP